MKNFVIVLCFVFIQSCNQVLYYNVKDNLTIEADSKIVYRNESGGLIEDLVTEDEYHVIKITDDNLIVIDDSISIEVDYFSYNKQLDQLIYVYKEDGVYNDIIFDRINNQVIFYFDDLMYYVFLVKD